MTATAQETLCQDGLDNDNDGLIDCFDSDCQPCVFNCEYIVFPGANQIDIQSLNTQTNPSYEEAFALLNPRGQILQLTTQLPVAFTNVSPAQYIAVAVSYEKNSGIDGLTVGSNINQIMGDCYHISESYAFEVCLGDPDADKVGQPLLKKELAKAPTQLPNGNYEVVYQFSLENKGEVEFCQISLFDEVASQMGCSFVSAERASNLNLIGNNGSSAPTVNGAFNGSQNTNLFNTDGCLFPGDRLEFSIKIEVDISCAGRPDPLLNSASVSAIDRNQNQVSDFSDSDFGLGMGDNEPTPLFVPQIAVTKALVGKTDLPNDELQLQFRFNIKNTGNTTFSNLSLRDPLSFSSSLSGNPSVYFSNIDATVLPNQNFQYDGDANDDLINGSPVDRLAPGESFSVYLTTVVDRVSFVSLPQSVENQAIASGLPLDNNEKPLINISTNQIYQTHDISDLSDDGTNLTDGGIPGSGNPNAANDNGQGGQNDPTKIILPGEIEFTKTLLANPVQLANNNFSASYEFHIINSGGVAFCQISLTENLAQQFGCAFVAVRALGNPILINNSSRSIAPSKNNAYNGNDEPDIFKVDGCIFGGDEVKIRVEVEVDPSCAGVPEPLENSAVLKAIDVDGNQIQETSDDRTDLNNDNQPDNETGGKDDPTHLLLPRIGLAKQLVNSEPIGNDIYVLNYEFFLKNLGNETLYEIQLEDDIKSQFGAAYISAQVISLSGNAQNIGTVNPNYNGQGGNDPTKPDGDDILLRNTVLEPGQSITVQIKVRMDADEVPPTGLINQAITSAKTNSGKFVSDLSDSGSDVFIDNDEPTPVDLGPIPSIEKQLMGSPTVLPDGKLSVRYLFTLENKGVGDLLQMQVEEDLATQFGCAFVSATPAVLEQFLNPYNSTAPTFNTAFNGSSQTNLLNNDGVLKPGDELSFYTEVVLSIDCANLPTPLANQAIFSGRENNGNIVTDVSDDQTDLNGDGVLDNDSGGNGDPTILFLPEISMTKSLTQIEDLGNGQSRLEFRFNIENTGTSSLSNIEVIDPMDHFAQAIIGTPTVEIFNQSTISLPRINNRYDGSYNFDMTIATPDELMHPGQSFSMKMEVVIDTDIFLSLSQNIENQAFINANPVDVFGSDLPGYDNVQDDSDDGSGLSNGGDPATDNPGATNDNGFGGMDDPTLIDLPSVLKISAAKEIMEVQPAASGQPEHFDFWYRIYIKNTGNISLNKLTLFEDMQAQMGSSFVKVLGTPAIVNSLTTATDPPKISNSYNGTSSSSDIFNGRSIDKFKAGEEIVVDLHVEIAIKGNGIINNQVEVSGAGPNGGVARDFSDAGSDPTTDNDDGDMDDPTIFDCPHSQLSLNTLSSLVCANDDVQVSLSDDIASATYEWVDLSQPNSIVSTSQNPLIQNIQETTTFQVTVIPTDGCYRKLIDTIRVEVSPEIQLTLDSDATGCVPVNTDIQFTSTIGGGTPGYSINWTGPNGFQSVEEAPLLPNVTNDNSGIYILWVTDAAGCFASEEMSIDVVTQQNEPIIDISDLTACGGETVEFSISNYFGTSIRYEWEGPQGSTASGDYPDAPIMAIPRVAMGDAGDYRVRVVTDGCQTNWSSFVQLEVGEKPLAQAENDATPCSGTADIQLSANPSGGQAPYSFYWRGPNGFISQIEDPIIAPNPNASGTYELVVTDAFGCQSEPTSTNLSIQNNIAIPQLSASKTELCSGESLLLNTTPQQGTVVSYLWQLPDGTTETTTDPSFFIEEVEFAAHNGLYEVQVMIDGCPSLPSTKVLVEVNDIPAKADIGSNQTICEGDRIRLFTNTAADSYQWSGPDGFTSDLPTPNVIRDAELTNGGTYSLTIQNGDCPSVPSTIVVDVKSRPITPTILPALPTCSGDSLKLSAVDAPDATAYQWLAPGMTGSSNFGLPNNPNNPLWTTEPKTTFVKNLHSNLYQEGEWRVRVIGTNGCASEISDPIDVDFLDAAFVPPVATNSPVCLGEDLMMSTINDPDLTVKWYDADPAQGGSLMTNNYEAIVSQLPLGGHTFYLVSESANCQQTFEKTIVVEVIEKPTLTAIDNNGPHCVGAALELSAPSLPGMTYEWSGPDGFTSDEQNPMIDTAFAENGGIYTLQVTNGQCASNPISTQVVITDQPLKPEIEYDGAHCEGYQVGFTAEPVNTAGNVTYQWSGPNGWTSDEQNPTIDSIIIQQSGNYSLVVEVNGCASEVSDVINVQIDPSPEKPNILNSTQVERACEGEDVVLESRFIQNMNYNWEGPNGFISNEANPVLRDVDISQAGIYTLQTEFNGCLSPKAVTEVFISDRPSVPEMISNGPICEGETLTLEIVNPNPDLQYTWYDSISNATVGDGSILTIENIQAAQGGQYYALAQGQDCGSLTNIDRFVFVQVDVPSNEDAFIGDEDFATCGDEAMLHARPLVDAQGFWQSIDGSNSSLESPNTSSTFVENLNFGENIFTWNVVSGACGVTSTDTLVVSQIDGPQAADDYFYLPYATGIDSTVLPNDNPNHGDFSVEVLESPKEGFLILFPDGTFNYQPPEGFIGTVEFTYQVCTDACPDHCVSAKAVIEVGTELECMAPTIFSPNGDGSNETFMVPCLSTYGGSELTIFNRWGDSVYQSDNYQNDWDGTYGNEPLPVGTYYYLLKVNDPEKTVLKGYLFLNR